MVGFVAMVSTKLNDIFRVCLDISRYGDPTGMFQSGNMKQRVGVRMLIILLVEANTLTLKPRTFLIMVSRLKSVLFNCNQ
jgi:hypothetical protein